MDERSAYQVAIFDFDGTLSLLRRGWQQVMIPMGVEYLEATGTRETREELHAVVESFVTRLTGKQTRYEGQMTNELPVVSMFNRILSFG